MTPEQITREQWGAKPAKSNPGGFVAVVATVAHYTAAGKGYPRANHADCYQQVRDIQAQHLAISNQSDIEYNHLICIHGSVFQGRMAGVKGGANGTAESNATMPSCCCLLGVGKAADGTMTDWDQPSPAMLDSLAWWHGQIEAKWGSQVPMKGHRDIISTSCPGDPLYRWVVTGGYRPPAPTPEPTPEPPEDDMGDRPVRQVWKGYHNVFLTTAVGAIPLSPEANKFWSEQGVPLVTNSEHQQSLQSVLAKAGLTAKSLVPSQEVPPWFQG